MFKKPLADAKTTAPIRGSDRRKLKQRVIAEFSLQPEEGDALVPEGLLSQKISTHLNEPGLVYLSPEGDPLWFSIGKGSDVLIPSVYTLWKKPDLLPFLSTPAPVVPKLIGGADLMIPGVVQHTTPLHPDQLVAVTQYHRDKLGAPLAVGRMAVDSDTLLRADKLDVKGKAVYVLHTWRDALWDVGVNARMDVPAPRDPPKSVNDGAAEEENGAVEGEVDAVAGDVEGLTLGEGNPLGDGPPGDAPIEQQNATTLSPEDVSQCLRSALLHALQTSLSALPPSALPIAASVFWANYVLPARPAQPLGPDILVDPSTIDIKNSTHKSVKVFLKACAKEGLIKLKETKSDVVVTAVYPTHPSVAGHHRHLTVQSVEEKKVKAEERERREKEAEEKKKAQIQIAELWKPHGDTVPWFVAAEKDTSSCYSIVDIKDIFNAYVTSKHLINAHEQQYINVGQDSALTQAVRLKGNDTPDFLKRDDALLRIRQNMQTWHEIQTEKSDPILKKGAVKPISIVVKTRQGNKAATLITGFEGYGIDADDLAEELRKVCASSTSVSALPGKTTDQEVMVQGKQIKTVTDFLVSKGVPAKWIAAKSDSKSKKK